MLIVGVRQIGGLAQQGKPLVPDLPPVPRPLAPVEMNEKISRPLMEFGHGSSRHDSLAC